ncbi:MAG: S53 family peptidase [Mycobacteriaceae bacterium]
MSRPSTSGPRRRPHRRAALAAATAVTTLTAFGITGGAAVAAVSPEAAVAGSVPSWANQTNDKGVAPADVVVEGEIYLPLRDEAGAQALALAVSTPGSSSYGKYLSPQQWINTYSPTRRDFNDIVKFVKGEGLTVTATPASRQYVVFRGPTSVVSAAFGTTLHTYSFAGRDLVAPSSTPTVPTSIKAQVKGLTIDQGRFLTHPNTVKPGANIPGVSANARSAAAAAPTAPCSTYFGQYQVTVPKAYGQTSFPTNICGYVPDQLRSAYGLSKLVNSGVNGAGQTVAIVDAYASPTIVSDTNLYALKTGSQPLTSSTYAQIVPKVSDFSDATACGGTAGWQGEQTLDVQSAHGVAPGAQILYVGGFNCGGGLDIALSKILDRKLSTIVSNSYGYTGEAVPSSVLQGEVNQHLQAAVEGIGLYFSSGDNGDEQAKLGYKSPDFPASSPFVTSVGGTSLEIAANGSYTTETGWGSAIDQIKDGAYVSPLPGAFAGGAGGGVSAQFSQPAYQAGVVPDRLANSQGGGASRVSPDVAALADPYTGFLIGLSPITDDATQATGSFITETYGGTSLASPITAAQVAVAQQATGRVAGFANPALYAGYKANKSITRDVKPLRPQGAVVYTSKRSGNTYLVSLDKDSSLRTTRGYDQTTGLGSVDVYAIASALRG